MLKVRGICESYKRPWQWVCQKSYREVNIGIDHNVVVSELGVEKPPTLESREEDLRRVTEGTKRFLNKEKKVKRKCASRKKNKKGVSTWKN
jgi:uncharacterized metal-binding protein